MWGHACGAALVPAYKSPRLGISRRVIDVLHDESIWERHSNRASTIPSNIRGGQSGTWSTGQENIRGTSTKLQREHENKYKNKNKNNKKKGTIAQKV